TPKRENCSFFATAAAAEKHGYRPCLRCRPELAPGHGLADLSGRLAQAAATLIDEGFLADAGVPELAAVLHAIESGSPRLFVGNLNVV
ncbi:adenosine deaminase, partial [Salmonella enterica]|nr:adenosine deaminase [Salmonella enterica]